MARKQDLMGLGLPPFIADRIAREPAAITVQGGSVGSAAVIGGTSFIVYVNATNAGNGMVLPTIAGQSGALQGDEFTVANQLAASVIVYAPSAATINSGGIQVAGTTGVSVAAGKATNFYNLTASSWTALSGA